MKSTSLEAESGRIALRVSGAFADSLQPKERVLSLSFLEAASCVCTKTSYRDAADILNRFLGRNDMNTIKLRTLSDSICRIGAEISEKLSDITAYILPMYGFDSESGLPLDDAALSENITAAATSQGAKPGRPEIDEIIAAVNDSREEKIPFSAAEIKIESVPEECVYISIDDIGVKHQKDSRKEGSVRDCKYVENTVAHIQYGGESYILTGIGMRNVFKSVLAFLLVNNLLSRELIFLTDGAQDLRSHIQSVFQFHPYTVILDWFHLKKRCQEWLSMAIRGKDRRNAILEKVLRYLWAGNVVGASEYLSSLDSADIKNRKWLNDLLGYFEKKGDAITCYALRAKLGLRNSSNPVEKANDLIVAGRQKHNGMAWSPSGSGALAALQMIYLNHQSDLWFHKKELRLFPPSLETAPKAA
ncbi:hypothetical protein [Eisenbergiella tayi]|uniref:hypothetical protein n=1 Tax=Eisenbergiella tayi TaxID=1432052 RepID=UPI002432C58D|nr:hypothetical protein [Eisenbergiella tayi]